MARPIRNQRSGALRLAGYDAGGPERRYRGERRWTADMEEGRAGGRTDGGRTDGLGAAETEPELVLAAPFPDVEPEDEAAARRAEDHALIRRAQRGDEAAFQALVERHRARSWRVA